MTITLNRPSGAGAARASPARPEERRARRGDPAPPALTRGEFAALLVVAGLGLIPITATVLVSWYLALR